MSNGLIRGKRLTGVTSDGIRHCPLFRTVVRARLPLGSDGDRNIALARIIRLTYDHSSSSNGGFDDEC